MPGTGTIYVDADLSIIRKRAVGNGFHEDLIILNHSAKGVDLEVKIEAGSDFADLFEVKDKLAKKGEFYTTVTDGRLVLGYRRETYERETWITSSVPAEIANTDTNTPTLTYHAHIEPHGQWDTGLDVSLGKIFKGIGYPMAKYHSAEEHAQPDMRKGLDDWIADAPRLVCEWETLTDTYKRSLVDLAALRFFPMGVPGAALPAAGLPWFMTVFGRDSMLTSLQALPFAPDLAESTLRTLAGRQGRRVDDFRDEEPGKIMHEQRFGEMTAFLERPHSPYYGSADVTPLFLVSSTNTSGGPAIPTWCGGSSRMRARPSNGSTNTATATGTATSSMRAAMKRRGWKTSAGKTPGTLSSSPMARSPSCPARPARSRATPTMRRCAAPGSRARFGATMPWRSAWTGRPWS